MAVPEVINRAAAAPVSGHGLGSTMWYACAWCAIIHFLVNIGLIKVRKHRPGLWQRRLLTVLVKITLLL